MIEYKEIRPFGPPILKFTLPQSLIDEFNAFIDEPLFAQWLDKLDYSEQLVGKVNSEVMVPDFLIKNNWRFFADVTHTFLGAYEERFDSIHTDHSIKETFDPKKEALVPALESAWFVRSYAGDYNPVHVHPGTHLASAGYLKLPDWEEEIIEDGNDHYGLTNGCLQFNYGHIDYFVKSTYTVQPKVGDFYLFPAWLPHCVYPFRSAGERRTLSMNFMVQKTELETKRNKR